MIFFWAPLAILGVVSALWIARGLSRVQPQTADLDFLDRRNLYAGHVARILDSADYRHYASRSPRYRGYLFRSYARNLRRDMAELSPLSMDPIGLLYRLLFEFLYRALLLKARMRVGQSDLRVLLGVELKLIRRLSA